MRVSTPSDRPRVEVDDVHTQGVEEEVGRLVIRGCSLGRGGLWGEYEIEWMYNYDNGCIYMNMRMTVYIYM